MKCVRWSKVSLVLVVLAAMATLLVTESVAFSLCVYDGQLYAKTTLEQEFRDSHVVVRGKVLSSKDVSDPYLGVFYSLQVEQTFKGSPAAILTDYTERDSGAFYLDAGTEYLLFLNPIEPFDANQYLGPNWRTKFRGTFMVNYSCGQSRKWTDVSPTEQERLIALSKQTGKASK
jgi:hypothetical protein